MTFAHFILTRYALRMPDNSLPDAEWLAHRRDIFERYTLPSVAAQTVQAFAWLVFFDSSLVEVAVDALRWEFRCPQLADIPCRERWDDCTATMRGAIRSYLPDDTTHVITTRLDNDDAIAPDFIELVQAQFVNQTERVFVNFDHGRNIDIRTGQERQHANPSNMFISCIEPVAGFQTVLAWAHGTCERLGSFVIRPRQTCRWTHLMHDRNVWPEGRTAEKHRLAG